MQSKLLIQKARELDVATANPAAIYDAGTANIQIWCTPQNNPGGKWTEIRMTAGAYAKPAEYVASFDWECEGERIVSISFETSAYALADHFPFEFKDVPASKRGSIHNRPQDIAWAKKQIKRLFRLVGLPCPPIKVEK